MRVYHPSGVYRCPVAPEVIAAIKEYKGKNGPRWKAKLVADWLLERDMPQPLRLARNVIGPSRLYKIKV